MSQINLTEEKGILLLRLDGTFIGGDETDKLRETLTKLAEQKENNLIINLSGVTFLSSIAIGVLIAAHVNFTKRNGKICICGVNKALENIFKISKLSMVLTIYADEQEAIKVIQK